MPDTVRVTWSLAFEFVAVHNVDLFRRGHYRVHLSFTSPEGGGVELSVASDTVTNIEGRHPATVTDDGKCAVSSSVLILYRQQRNILADNFEGLLHFSLPCKKLGEISEWPVVRCTLELHHAPNSPQNTDAPPATAFTKVSRHRLYLRMCPKKHQLHAHRPFLFDFCHLAGVQLRIHAVLANVALDVSEPAPTEKAKTGFRTAVKNLLPSSESSSKPFRKSSRPSRSHSFKGLDHARKSRRLTDASDQARSILSPAALRYRVDTISLVEARHICRLLLESKAALAEMHQMLIGGTLPTPPDVDELLNKMYRKGRRESIPWSDAQDYVLAIRGEISALWAVFLGDISEIPSASQRLLFQCQHQRILRWREGVLTQSQPISNCLALDVDQLPRLDCTQLQAFAEKITTDLYGRLAFKPLPLACKVVDGTHRNMPFILEQVFAGEDTSHLRKNGFVKSSDTLVPFDDSAEESGASNLDSSQPLLTLGEFLSSHAIARKQSEESVESTQSRSELMTLREFLNSGLAKHRSSGSSIASSTSSAEGDDMMTMDEFLSIVRSATHEDSEDSNNDPAMTMDEFLSQVSPACSQAIQRSRSLTAESGPNSTSQAMAGDDRFTVDELLAVFATERVASRSCDSTSDLTLSDFLGGDTDCQQILAFHDNTAPDCSPLAEDSISPTATDFELQQRVPAEPVDMSVPSCRPSMTGHQGLVNEAKELIRPGLPSSWGFLSDGAAEFLPAPYFSSVESFQSRSKPVHLVVCVHGLEGLHLDLRMFSIYLKLALPDAGLMFLKSKSNEQNTNNDFVIMIEALVKEITAFIEDKELNVSHLSFVGHSLGNIIIRGALAHPALSCYLPLLQVYVSFAAPHLGTAHANSVVSTGMWLMRKWKKSTSLCQLAMKDTSDKRRSFLYQLSLKPGLALFKSVLLVASHQDQYVPFHSAHIGLHTGGDDEELSRIHMEMVQNLLRPLQYSATQLSRYTVVHHFQSNVDVNVLVGRAGHVAVLDNDLFLEKFVALFCAPKFVVTESSV
eukprot:scpid25046/ scgid3311/ Protein FAM135A